MKIPFTSIKVSFAAFAFLSKRSERAVKQGLFSREAATARRKAKANRKGDPRSFSGAQGVLVGWEGSPEKNWPDFYNA
ncbi:MAG: hypothetical protein JXB25_02675 [Deltaproteobacteria bacterium]|nr:hypothetical protein [Deltaproteobacteria bacterium]